MAMRFTGAIELLPAEAETLKALKLNQEEPFRDTDAARRNGELAVTLTKSLLNRGAIPEQRLRYCDDPAYRTGRVKGSYRYLFERNGAVGDEVYRHPNFLKCLRYFLFGADLPQTTIDEFSARADALHPVGPSDALELGKLAKKLTRSQGLSPLDAAEEFYKLALDCGIYQGHAIRIRDIAKRMR